MCFDAWNTCNKYLSHEILCYMCLNLINCFFGQLINCLCSVFELFFPDGFWGSIRPGNVLPKVQTPRFLLVLAIIPFVFHERILLVKFLFFFIWVGLGAVILDESGFHVLSLATLKSLLTHALILKILKIKF